jgi:DtxR family Mn-dependent transcriptional regulator
MKLYTSTVENYIKQLFLLSDGDGIVSMKRLIAAMEVTAGTVTTMMKGLSEQGLVDYTPREGVRLTEAGRAIAAKLLRRHRLIERFLVEVLRLDWSDVHGEAEVLEHAVSDRIVDRMDMILGYPAAGPHGKPIPDAEGRIARRELERLSAVESGVRVRVEEIRESDPELLRLVTRSGIEIGSECEVLTDPTAGTITLLQTEKEALTLGRETASALLVSRA